MSCLTRIILFCTLHSFSASLFAQSSLTLAAPDMPPFVSSDFGEEGYIAQIVNEAFESQGINTDIEFFPLIRARLMAESGRAAAVFPLHHSSENEAEFLLSDPVQGDELWVFSDTRAGVGPQMTYGSERKSLYGVLRGQSFPELYKLGEPSDQYSVTTNKQLIDLLDAGRVSKIVMDKYTLANVVVNHRPHLIGRLKREESPVLKKPFYVGFSRNEVRSEEYRQAFNNGLAYLKSSGRYQAILRSHGIYHMEDSGTPSDITVINIAAISNQFIKNIQSLTPEFERQHPGIKVNWIILDENTLRRRLMEDVAIDEGYFDILTIGAYEAQIWAKKGWISPLKDIPDSYNLSDITASLIESASYQNEVYVLPFLSESTMSFYRKDLFSAAGITLPEEIRYDRLEEYIREVHDPDNGVYGIGFRGKAGWGQNMAFVSVLVNSFGGRWFNEDWEPMIDTEQWRQALRYYKNIMHKYGPPESYLNGWKENQTLFIEGKLAFLVDATSFAPVLFDQAHTRIVGKIGVRNPPVDRFRPGAHWLWWWGLAINSQSDRKQAAQQFILWATSQEYSREIVRRKGANALPLGLRASVMDDEISGQIVYADKVLRSIHQASSTRFTQQPVPYTGPQFVSIPEFPAIGNQVGAKVAQMLKGEKTVDEVLKESQFLVRKIMDKAGYYSNSHQSNSSESNSHR